MAVNYNDSRFQEVEKEKQAALNNVNNTYNQMINQSDSYYNSLANQVQDYANKQTEIQQANTDFAIDKIEQQKDWATKDYQKEQKAAYTDYQKGIDNYGVNNENMAASGLTNTGYSESSRVSMFNTYQNRYATARDTFNRAIQNYDNGIREAQLSNNAKLAEIAANAQAKALELALQGFQYKNTLLQSQLNAQQTTEDRYYSRWKDTLNQINTENQLAEQKRQFNAQLSANKKAAQIYKDGGISPVTSNDTTEYQLSKSFDNLAYTDLAHVLLSKSGQQWYKNEFNKHSYQKKDLDYVLREAVNSGKITKKDATKIYKGYGITA
jgi:hypothetical protein